MFRCAITKKLSKSGENQIKLVVETRQKRYFAALKDEEGKTIYQRDDNGDVLRNDDGVPQPVLTKIGDGFETIKEIAVTQEGYDNYLKSKEIKD